jgi:uncharacterized membrane protein YgcG
VTTTQSAVAIAATLAIVWIAFTFGAFLLVAIAMIIGALVGRYLEGRLDVSGIVSAVRGRRSSS